MSSRSESRPYRKVERARREEETRLRITKAAVELHGSVGPARTSVTEVARLAGVSRMTVYNHFPTDVDLFMACSTHWATENPFPDPGEWSEVDDPSERLRTALSELYGWYRDKQGMLSMVFRDIDSVPALGTVMGQLWSPYAEAMVAVLSQGWPAGSAPRELRAVLHLAVDFHTWSVLTSHGLDDRQGAELASRLASGTASPGSHR